MELIKLNSKHHQVTPTQVGSGTDEGIDSNGTSTTGVIKDKDNDTIDSGFYKPTYNLGD